MTADVNRPVPRGVLVQEPCLVRTVWGAARVAAARGIEGPVGTSWEVSRHPHGESRVVAGPWAGVGLGAVVDADPAGCLGGHAMVRGVFLDAAEALSVQVHPQEDYARTHEGDHGKTETWYVVEAEPGATIVAGTSASSVEELKAAVEDGSLDALLVRVPVSAGDVVHVPAGTLHALGAGVLAAELGSDSDVTYRFFDYGRTDASGAPRELHVEQGLAVVDPTSRPQVVGCGTGLGSGMRASVSADGYEALVLDVSRGLTWDPQGRPAAVMVVEGSGTASWEGGTAELATFESAFVPAATGPVSLTGPMRLFCAVGA